MASVLSPVPMKHDWSFSAARGIFSTVADTALRFGAFDSAGVAKRTDLYFCGATSSDYMFLDASQSELSLAGGMHFNPAGVVQFFDDFLGDLIEDGWNSQADTGGTIALATVPGVNGV